MEKQENKPIVESKVEYDERKKTLTNTKKETKDTDLGKLEVTSKGIYNEESIKTVINNLAKTKKQLEENIKKLEELNAETPEMTPELEKLKEQLTTLQKINHDENIPEKDKQKEINDLEDMNKRLKDVNKDIEDIKKAIGGRLKLD